MFVDLGSATREGSQRQNAGRAHDLLSEAMALSGRAACGDALVVVSARADDPLNSLRQAVLLREAVEGGRLSAARPLFEGGLMVAAADLAVASGVGVVLEGDESDPLFEDLFDEAPGRFLVAARDLEAVRAILTDACSQVTVVGHVAGDALVWRDAVSIPLSRLREKYSRIFRTLGARRPAARQAPGNEDIGLRTWGGRMPA